MAPTLPILLASALAAAGPAAFKPYTAPGGAWSAEAPAGWTAQVDEVPERAVTFVGPPEPGQNRKPAILCVFYPSAHPQMPTPESFVAGMSTTAPEFKLRATKPREAKAGGRPGRRFRTSRLVTVPDARRISRDVRSVDDFVTVPVEGGYYALQLSVSEKHYQALKPAFERFLRTFRLRAK